MGAKWTFMVYMAGNNSLSDVAGEDLEEMRKVGSSGDVQVLAFMKQAGTRTAHHIHVGKGGRNETREELGDADSGDPQRVLDFFRWAVKRAPAERYALVLWNHGGGWAPDDLEQLYSELRADTGVNRRELNRRANQSMARTLFSTTVKQILARPTEAERQICNDDGTGHSLDTIELGNVLRLAAREIGGQIDLLGMDACLMSTLEVAYQVRGEARVIVGSEDLEPGAGWCYDTVLGDLAAKPDMDAPELGRVVVDRYVESYRELPSQWPVTQAAVRADHARRFSQAIDGLERALRPHLRTAWPKVMGAQARSVRFESELIDLRTFCRNLIGAVIDPGVTAAARAVVDAIKPGGYVVAEGHLGPKVEGCGGISVYFPAPTDPISKYYKDLRFAKAHRWDGFLKNYQRAARG
jgi:hypothetical protein